MTDSQFSVAIGAFLAIICLISGYAYAKASSPKWVDCEANLYTDHHISVVRVMKCEVK